jgi:hypothetical protein
MRGAVGAKRVAQENPATPEKPTADAGRRRVA